MVGNTRRRGFWKAVLKEAPEELLLSFLRCLCL
jgi:hypothetical protein